MKRLVFASSLCALGALSAAADPLLSQARANLEAEGPVYVYEMDYSDGEISASGKVDPSQPEGERITIYSPDESEWSEEFRGAISSLDSEVTGDIFCDDFAARIPDSAKRTQETDETVRYTFAPIPEEDADKMEQKIMKKLEASAVVAESDGQILSFNMVLPKPFKPAMVAKIETFSLDVQCLRAPDGRTYLETLQLDVTGSAMMQDFTQTMTRKITRILDAVELP